jgi:hypothetical protein
MSTETGMSIDQIVGAWRASAGPDSPAGPLFTSGPYAESEITMSDSTYTGLHCPTVCTNSNHNDCC